PCSCWTGPFLVFMGAFYSWAGLLSAPFSLWAGSPRRVLCVGHPHCVWAWWALAAMALTPTGAVADASTTAPVPRGLDRSATEELGEQPLLLRLLGRRFLLSRCGRLGIRIRGCGLARGFVGGARRRISAVRCGT